MKKKILFLLLANVHLAAQADEIVKIFKVEPATYSVIIGQNQDNKLVGSAVGALAGGAIGHSVASHKHRLLGTVVGSLAGAAIGDGIADNIGQTEKKVTGVKITYSSDAKYFYTSHQPGKTCQFAIGEAVLSNNLIQTNHRCE